MYKRCLRISLPDRAARQQSFRCNHRLQGSSLCSLFLFYFFLHVIHSTWPHGSPDHRYGPENSVVIDTYSILHQAIDLEFLHFLSYIKYIIERICLIFLLLANASRIWLEHLHLKWFFEDMSLEKPSSVNSLNVNCLRWWDHDINNHICSYFTKFIKFYQHTLHHHVFMCYKLNRNHMISVRIPV